MFYSPPSVNDIALQALMDYGTNSPRARLTAMAYLLENGQGPETVGDARFVQLVDLIVNTSNDHIDDFLSEVTEVIELANTPKPTAEDEDDGPGEEVRRGYDYL